MGHQTSKDGSSEGGLAQTTFLNSENMQVRVGQSVEVAETFQLQGRELRRGLTGEVVEVVADPDAGTRIKVRFFSNPCPLSASGAFFSKDALELTGEDLEHLTVTEEPRANCVPCMFLVLIVVLTVYGLLNAKSLEEKFACLVHWSTKLGLWAALLMFGCAVLLPVIMMPVFPLMALSGPLFAEMYDSWALGGTIAFVAVFSGFWLGSVTAFALGKTIFRSTAERAGKKNSALKRINRIAEAGGIRIVLMARALPLLPAEVFDYACAVTTLQISQYAIGCLGSAVPVAFWTYTSAQAASAARDSTSGSNPVGKIGLIAINMAALATLSALVVHTIRREEAKTPEGPSRLLALADSNLAGPSPDEGQAGARPPRKRDAPFHSSLTCASLPCSGPCEEQEELLLRA